MFANSRLLRSATYARLLVTATLVGGAFVSAVAGAGRASAQDATAVATNSPATVTVLGQGSVTVKPDIASLSVGVSATESELGQAQREVTRLMTAVIAAIKAAGVDDEDIQTSSYNVYAITRYDDTGNPSGVLGYQVSNQVQVMVRDLDAVNSVLEDAVAAGANTIYGVTFGIADSSAAESQARAFAVADAKRRAEELATAAEMTLGRIVSMSEGVIFPSAYLSSQGAGGQGGGGPIESGSLKITVDVQVTYELV
jgi:uncharacterized protein YggE